MTSEVVCNGKCKNLDYEDGKVYFDPECQLHGRVLPTRLQEYERRMELINNLTRVLLKRHSTELRERGKRLEERLIVLSKEFNDAHDKD